MADMEKPLEGRIALITGASRGIGAAVACQYAAAGAHVILVARTQGGLEETDDAIKALGGTATLVPTDLTDFDVIDTMGAALFERFGKLDILVGNAGILGTLTPVHHIDPKEWDRVIAINLTTNYRLLRSLDPLLRQSDAGRVLFVTDATGADPKPFWAGYAVSKAGLENLVRLYAAEVANTTNIKINLIDPGPTRTRLRTSAFPGENKDKLRPPESVAAEFIFPVLPTFEETGTVIRCTPPL